MVIGMPAPHSRHALKAIQQVDGIAKKLLIQEKYYIYANDFFAAKKSCPL
jgi:hypothetical protein